MRKSIVARRSLIVFLFVAGAFAPFANADPINPGDVFVALNGGKVRHYANNGNVLTLLETLNTGHSSAQAGGMAFDGNGDLFVVNFNSSLQSISRFRRSDGAQLPDWSTPGVYNAEDLLFDGTCYAWVGNVGAEAGGGIHRYDPSGTLVGTYLIGQRVDWLDLASDQKTMLYTHEGQGSDAILRADVTSAPGTLLPDLVPALPASPGRVGYAVKILPNGDVLVTDREDIRRYAHSGPPSTPTPPATPATPIAIYDVPGHDEWFGMCLGVGGTSFWAVDIVQHDVVNIRLSDGFLLSITPMNDPTSSFQGVIVAGGYTAAGCLPPPCTPPPSGMVAWWPLDELAGANVVTDIADGNNGTPRTGPVGLGGPTPGAGEVAGALCFNGTSDFVQVQSASAFNFGTGSFSIDAWIKLSPGAGTGTMPIVGNMGPNPLDIPYGYTFYVNNGNLGFQMSDDILNVSIGGVDLSTLVPGLWYHVAVTVDRTPSSLTGGKLFINGGPPVTTFDTTPFDGATAGFGGGLTIGATFPTRGPGAFFNGCIDEVEVFDRVLSQPEIQDIYQAGSAGKCKAASIPTLSEWGLIIFAVLLAGWMTFVVVRRWRRSHAMAA